MFVMHKCILMYIVLFLFLTEKMDKIETLLYKVLIATESHDDGTCLPTEYFEKTKDCLNEGDIMCTSIDLLTNKAVCYNCSSCSDNTVVQCHRYRSLNKTLHVPFINVDIEPDGSILQLDMKNIKAEKFHLSSPCDCTWSQYNYTLIFNKSHLQHYNSTDRPQLLRCQCDDVNYDQLYCPLGDSCFIRKAKCSTTATGINCTIVKYSEKPKQGDKTKRDGKIEAKELIINLNGKCSQWETVQSNCSNSVEIIFDDKDMEIVRNLKVDEHLNVTNVGNIAIVCPKNNCSRPFNVMCNESFNIGSCNFSKPATIPISPKDDQSNKQDGDGGDGDGGGGGNKKDNSYTTLLVIIIIVLLLLLLLYVGYQNHQKVSTNTYMCTW